MLIIGLKSLKQEILVDFGTGIMVESLKHCGTVHWLWQMLKLWRGVGRRVRWDWILIKPPIKLSKFVWEVSIDFRCGGGTIL